MNKEAFNIATLLFFICFIFCKDSLAWDNEVTHKDLSEYATESSVLGNDKGDYLKNLGFVQGIKEQIIFNRKVKKVFEWIQEGAELEDAGGNLNAFLGAGRFNNHFHNPLKPWGSAGLDDTVMSSSYRGESSILWAQYGSWQASYPEGDWSWKKIRDCFYLGLTSKTDAERQANFAQIFKGLGHQIHLIQDTSVPAHVRNDAHPEDSLFGKKYYLKGDLYFETWAKKNPALINSFASAPTFPQVALNITHDGFTPISQFIDAEQYNAGVIPTTNLTWGLSEYTNSNFVSVDTIFTDNFNQTDGHYFPYPKYSSQCYEMFEAEDIFTLKKQLYLSKTCEGERVKRFLAVGPLFKYLSFSWNLQRLELKHNSATHYDYTENLIPRAVGYSAGLLNYFFRGDIRLEYVTSPQPGYVIVNKTGEKLDGDFRIYYDNRNNERHLLWNGIGNLEAVMNDKTNPFDFILPDDAKEPGKYILVFKGNMGNEKGAVAGYVNSRVLEITPPSQYIYSMADGSEADPYFTRIRAKVKNASPGEQMRSGTVQAVAKYKADTYDAGFIYSISEPRAIDLSSNAPVEVEFNFDNDPIPADVTDLNLEIVFKGTIGSEADAMAFGIKDISEPTPIDVFNNTDKSCINGSWYSTAEAIALMDTDEDHIADKWDVNPHILQDIYVKVSSMENPQNASPSVYNAVVPFLYPGEFKRVIYILTDHNFKYSFYETWTWDPGYTDYWQHGAKLGTYNGTAVKNQTDFTSDPAVCGSDPWCYIYRYPVYYFLRDNETWWGGGLVYINWPYPYNSSCQGY